ncbi:MAG: hypothetical protein HY290_04740 [Planctomycetia bacterium]|nr:hypothetical protein [Planctomycetia bacterium]
MGPLLVPISLIMMVSLALMLLGWRTAQRALGFAPADDWIEEAQWQPGDQLAYLANQALDDTQGQWRRPEWPGRPAARGQIFYRAWRDGM